MLKLESLETRFISWEESGFLRSNSNEHANIIDYDEYNLPLQDMQTLKQFEELLTKDKPFADQMVKYIVGL